MVYPAHGLGACKGFGWVKFDSMMVGTEVRCRVDCFWTVERGTRDPSLQGRMYGVSRNSPPDTGPDVKHAPRC